MFVQHDFGPRCGACLPCTSPLMHNPGQQWAQAGMTRGVGVQPAATGQPSAGGVESGGIFEVVEEGAGGLQVGRIEAFGKPAEDGGE